MKYLIASLFLLVALFMVSSESHAFRLIINTPEVSVSIGNPGYVQPPQRPAPVLPAPIVTPPPRVVAPPPVVVAPPPVVQPRPHPYPRHSRW